MKWKLEGEMTRYRPMKWWPGVVEDDLKALCVQGWKGIVQGRERCSSEVIEVKTK